MIPCTLSQHYNFKKSLTNRVEGENSVSGMEDKVEKLDQLVKDHEKIVRKYE
jgi:hypothetical protein